MSKKRDYTLFLLVFPSVFIGIIATILMYWPLSTKLSIALTVDRVVFTVGGTESVQLMDPAIVSSLTVDHFSSIEFNPYKLEVANPLDYQLHEDRYPDSAWTLVPLKDKQVTVVGGSQMQQYAVTFESPEIAKLDRVWMRPGSKVTLEIRGRKFTNLTIAVEKQTASAFLQPATSFQLISDNCNVNGITQVPYRANSLTYRVWLPDNHSAIEITSQRQDPYSLVLNLTLSPTRETNQFLSTNKITVTTLDFSRQSSTGPPKSTLLKATSVSYPEYPNVDKKDVKDTDFVTFNDLQNFMIEKMSLDPENNGIQLRLSGISGNAWTGTKDLRLTCFEALWYHRKIVAVFGILVWVFPTSVGIYNFFKERKGKKP